MSSQSTIKAHTHTHTMSPNTAAVCLWAVSPGKVIGPCLSWNEPRDINTHRELYPRNKEPIQKQVKLCSAFIYRLTSSRRLRRQT